MNDAAGASQKFQSALLGTRTRTLSFSIFFNYYLNILSHAHLFQYRARIRERSYKLLEDARILARDMKKYDSDATRQIMTQKCQERVGVTPYPEQLDLAECMLLGLDATSIAGTGWGKTLTFVLPLFAPQSKGKTVIIVSPLNALEEDQVSIILPSFHYVCISHCRQAARFQKMGLKAAVLNGDTNKPELLKVCRQTACQRGGVC